MARITTRARDEFDRRFADYREETHGMLEHQEELRVAAETDAGTAGLRRIELSESLLDLAGLYLLRNQLSERCLGISDVELLDNARGCCEKSVILAEGIVGDTIDAPLSEIATRLDAIEDLADHDRYTLVRKMGFTIESVEDAHGESSRWRWYFVDLEGRFTTVARNLLNLRTLVAGLDPREAGYEVRLDHLRMVKDQLERSASRSRRKFVQNSQQIIDFRRAISFLSALRRVHALLGEGSQAEDVKRRIAVWTSVMEREERRLEKEKAALP